MAENNTPVTEQEEDYTPDLVTLEDEEGKEHTFEVIDAADHKGVHYMALVPYVENEEELEDADLDLILMRSARTRRASTWISWRTTRSFTK